MIMLYYQQTKYTNSLELINLNILSKLYTIAKICIGGLVIYISYRTLYFSIIHIEQLQLLEIILLTINSYIKIILLIMSLYKNVNNLIISFENFKHEYFL
jgi:hypothetical protein